MRYHLRTLLIVLAIMPPVLAAAWPYVWKLLHPPVMVTPRIILGEPETPVLGLEFPDP